MRLGNHRIACGNRRRKIPPGGAVVSKRKIIRTEHQHGPQRLQHGPQIDFRVNRRQRRRRRLAQLTRGAGQFHRAQTRADRQAGFHMRRRHELNGPGLDARREGR